MKQSANLATAAADLRVALSMRDLEESWRRCSERLRAELGEDVFTSWFGRMTIESVENGRAHFSVPTRFLKSWIESHYNDRILAAIEAEIGGVGSIVISVRSSSAAPTVQAAAPAKLVPGVAKPVDLARPGPTRTPAVAPVGAAPRVKSAAGAQEETIVGSPLDRRLSFASFLVGRSNQLAFSAAQRVAEVKSGEPPAYSPLYVHAAVGLGKTHLLQAIAHAAAAQGRKVVYLTAERFMYGFVAALQAQTAIAYKEALRSIDLLIFDDAQFLQGKTIQTEFGHALNALLDSGRQVMVAADRPPADLESLEERVRSRLAGGLCVEMGALDEALRVKILEARIAAARLQSPHFEVSPAVLAFVAKSIASNGRDLEGAVNRLLAHSIAGAPPLTVEAAENAIRDLIRAREPKRVKIEDIQKFVANHYSVTRADILSSRRTATVVKPRQVAMYLSKALTLRSLPEIGRRFGGRDHTTVLHAVRKIEGLTASDAALREEIELLKRMLQE
ncbi:MAG: chromosomal replication initiator protein DnaA [Hyphomicrobiales bacterium]|nr:chromosomal replication initiator protein DnaA [Hyphomicrobiales bacterium]